MRIYNQIFLIILLSSSKIIFAGDYSLTMMANELYPESRLVAMPPNYIDYRETPKFIPTAISSEYPQAFQLIRRPNNNISIRLKTGTFGKTYLSAVDTYSNFWWRRLKMEPAFFSSDRKYHKNFELEVVSQKDKTYKIKFTNSRGIISYLVVMGMFDEFGAYFASEEYLAGYNVKPSVFKLTALNSGGQN